MDNFAGVGEGDDPANWFFRRYGQHATIASPKNQTGNWLQLGAEPVSIQLLKKPLPEDFTLEYDLATDGDLSSRTGGLSNLILNTRPSAANGSIATNNNGTTVNINIQSGNEADYDNNNYHGVIKGDINASPFVNKQNYTEGISYTYPLREFTNKKTTVHFVVTIKEALLTVFINDRPVAASTDFKLAYGGNCISCGVSAGTKFNAIYWANSTNDAAI